ncbi:MAG TPA: trypsin-like peptidase domain-containing protein [Anaerolineae bacterium]|jgi:2-alkenal reductase
MADQPNPKKKQPQQPENPTDDLIVTPISIARARHASTRGASAIDKTRRVSVTQQHPQSDEASSIEIGPYRLESNNNQAGGFNGCLFLSLISLAFLVGGFLGGLVGGSLIVWSNNSEVALWEGTATPTLMPSPTPAPAETLTPTPTVEPMPTPLIEDRLAAIMPSVVTVVNEQHLSLGFNGRDEGRVVGSGVIIDQRGYVATNHHVIENAGELRVVLSDGRELVAELVASDPAEDLAVLKVSQTDLPTIPWGDSAILRPGQIVYAIGSPLGDFPNSVSLGIVSGLNRALELESYVIDGLIQTDAAINRGSSGGPLINSHGEMVGINTFIIRESEERGVAEGIAFTIPANTAKILLMPWINAYAGESVAIPAGESNN